MVLEVNSLKAVLIRLKAPPGGRWEALPTGLDYAFVVEPCLESQWQDWAKTKQVGHVIALPTRSVLNPIAAAIRYGLERLDAHPFDRCS